MDRKKPVNDNKGQAKTEIDIKKPVKDKNPQEKAGKTRDSLTNNTPEKEEKIDLNQSKHVG